MRMPGPEPGGAEKRQACYQRAPGPSSRARGRVRCRWQARVGTV